MSTFRAAQICPSQSVPSPSHLLLRTYFTRVLERHLTSKSLRRSGKSLFGKSSNGKLRRSFVSSSQRRALSIRRLNEEAIVVGLSRPRFLKITVRPLFWSLRPADVSPRTARARAGCRRDELTQYCEAVISRLIAFFAPFRAAQEMTYPNDATEGVSSMLAFRRPAPTHSRWGRSSNKTATERDV